MKRVLRLFGFILFLTGLAIAAFTAVLFVSPLPLMQELIERGQIIPETQQYIMGAILAIIFIMIGFLMLKE